MPSFRLNKGPNGELTRKQENPDVKPLNSPTPEGNTVKYGAWFSQREARGTANQSQETNKEVETPQASESTTPAEVGPSLRDKVTARKAEVEASYEAGGTAPSGQVFYGGEYSNPEGMSEAQFRLKKLREEGQARRDADEAARKERIEAYRSTTAEANNKLFSLLLSGNGQGTQGEYLTYEQGDKNQSWLNDAVENMVTERSTQLISEGLSEEAAQQQARMEADMEAGRFIGDQLLNADQRQAEKEDRSRRARELWEARKEARAVIEGKEKSRSFGLFGKQIEFSVKLSQEEKQKIKNAAYAKVSQAMEPAVSLTLSDISSRTQTIEAAYGTATEEQRREDLATFERARSLAGERLETELAEKRRLLAELVDPSITGFSDQASELEKQRETLIAELESQKIEDARLAQEYEAEKKAIEAEFEAIRERRAEQDRILEKAKSELVKATAKMSKISKSFNEFSQSLEGLSPIEQAKKLNAAKSEYGDPGKLISDAISEVENATINLNKTRARVSMNKRRCTRDRLATQKRLDELTKARSAYRDSRKDQKIETRIKESAVRQIPGRIEQVLGQKSTAESAAVRLKQEMADIQARFDAMEALANQFKEDSFSDLIEQPKVEEASTPQQSKWRTFFSDLRKRFDSRNESGRSNE
jgi:hypothetical protein